MPEETSQFIFMNDIRRVFPGLFPLDRIGILKNMAPTGGMPSFHGKLELCFRFSNESNVSRDMINGVEYETPFPNIFLKVPHLYHSTCIEKSRDAIYFAYNPALFERMQAIGLLEPPYLWHCEMTSDITSALNKITEMTSHIMEYGTADRIDLMAFQLFQDVILKRGRMTKNSNEQLIEKKIQKIASHLQLNFNHEIDLEKLYRSNGLSRRTFFRYWSNLFDLTPAQYVLELKLNHAMHRLIETNMPIWQICSELNFKNPHYLSLLFKKRYDITPSEYRHTQGHLKMPD